MQEYVIVDGYNMIGGWPLFRGQESKGVNLDGLRRLLVEKLVEYGAFTGRKIIVVFDAHQVKSKERKYYTQRIEVVYTREDETADEYIEKLVRDLKRVDRKIYVATSDLTEQWTVFSLGALRLSARELFEEIRHNENEISKQIRQNDQKLHRNKIRMNEETEKTLEKWRRGNFSSD